MTYQEAHKVLEKRQRTLTGFYGNVKNDDKEFVEANRMAIEACEKQIPKKPTPYAHYEGQCPNCLAVFEDRLTKYCGNCGQALDWEEAE